jgi:hypothetical protein
MPVASETQAYGYHLLALGWDGGVEEGSAKGREIPGVVLCCDEERRGGGEARRGGCGE